MKTYIIKASSDTFIAIKDFQTIKDIENFIKENGDIIISKNTFWKGVSIREIKTCFDTKSNEIAKRISESKYCITIYDDYIE